MNTEQIVSQIQTSIKNIPGFFSIQTIQGECVTFSQDLNQSMNINSDTSVLESFDEDWLPNESTAVLTQLKHETKDTNTSCIRYFKQKNKLNYQYHGFLKSIPIHDHKELLGFILDLMPTPFIQNMSNTNNNWLAHPDVLMQTLMDGSYHYRSFSTEKGIVSLNKKEGTCLYYLLLGYNKEEISSSMRESVLNIKNLTTTLLSKFHLTKVSDLMHLLFSKQLFTNYNLNYNTVLTKHVQNKVKQLLKKRNQLNKRFVLK